MSEFTTSGGSTDLRGFVYALAPFVRKQQWIMDRLQAEEAQVRRAISEAEQQRADLDTDLRSQSAHIQQGLVLRPDPQAYRHGLAYLAQLHQRIQALTQSIDDLRQQRAALLERCTAQQRKLNGLDEHRTQAEGAYAYEIRRLEAAEIDRDWLGRAHFRGARSGAHWKSVA